METASVKLSCVFVRILSIVELLLAIVLGAISVISFVSGKNADMVSKLESAGFKVADADHLGIILAVEAIVMLIIAIMGFIGASHPSKMGGYAWLTLILFVLNALRAPLFSAFKLGGTEVDFDDLAIALVLGLGLAAAFFVHGYAKKHREIEEAK